MFITAFVSALIALQAPAKLYLPEDLPSKPNRLENAIKATAWIKSVRTSDKCSGFFISEDGYYATALHCISECLRLHDQYPNSDRSTEYEHPGAVDSSDFHKIFRVSPLKTPIVCPDLAVTFPGGNWEGYSSPELLVVGHGWATVKNNGIDQLTEQQFELLQDSIDDYAILKFKVRRKLECLSVGKPVSPGDSLWPLGFPTETDREEGFNSDGRSRYGSVGEARSSIKEDTYLQSLEMTALDWSRQEKLTSQSKYLMMTSDIVSQMSGSAVLDSNGQAVAIAYSSSAKDSLTKPFWGTSFGMRLDYVRAQAEKQLGYNPFSCRN